MTVDQLFQRRVSRPAESVEPDALDDLNGYGVLRSLRDRCLAVELRKKDDSILAIPYAHIEQFLYSPTDGITLRALGRDIRIRGRNLNYTSEKSPGLFSALVRHRAAWVQEKSQADRPASDTSAVIESVTW
jgi:hypothetical protein